MKKIKLSLVSTLVCFLILTLFMNGDNPCAKSQSGTFEMTSDVLCGTGGKSQSTTFTLKISAGAQPSPIGKQTSTNFDALTGWVYTSQPSFTRGDATGDGIVNIADVVFLVNYLFSGGDPPCPEEAGDATCDGIINIADVVYLVNYLFGGGPPPSCGGKNSSPWLSPSKLETNLGKAEIGMSLSALSEGSLMRLADEFEITVEGKFDQDVAGIQLEIGYDPQEVTLLEPKLTSRTERLSIFFGGEEGIQKIGIVDLTGKNVIPAGDGPLLILKAKGNPENIEIRKAILVDRKAKMLVVKMSPSIEVNLEKASLPLPDHFALSQNYPNPFNPETNIEYALPKDTDVKLTIYNVLGERVKVLVDEHQTAGYKRVYWNGTDQKGEDVASGPYFYRLETKEFSKVKKMMLVK